MSYLDWKVGDRVVCVDDLQTPLRARKWPGVIYPQIGCIYTIREIYTEAKFRADPTLVWVRLVEIVNAGQKTYIGLYEPGFHAGAFRKVEPRKTDISIFTAMLHDSTEKVPA